MDENCGRREKDGVFSIRGLSLSGVTVTVGGCPTLEKPRSWAQVG